ncbi:hypothetical protein [Streptomyces ficellus]|uniref:Uncharacterized protein n=1 Tax=Streptomyces ficellus TaxID=1977088 RepID=A0A6I6FPS5_9ACTN|nr:hypothetical protein [Streptomyces ficellus]QGV81399.1 hypothetical protein EIZ62_26505 [Streptomyces ficellus]
MPEQQISGPPQPVCAYCPKPGADVCVRTLPSTSGPDRAVLAHRACAETRGVRPLYELVVPAGSAR